MSERDHGGPAFPYVFEGGRGSGLNSEIEAGMTLRDYFAGQALAGMNWRDFLMHGQAAVEAYDMADAMLEARKDGGAS